MYGKVILSRSVVGMMHSDALSCNGFTHENTPYARYLGQRAWYFWFSVFCFALSLPLTDKHMMYKYRNDKEQTQVFTQLTSTVKAGEQSDVYSLLLHYLVEGVQ